MKEPKKIEIGQLSTVDKALDVLEYLRDKGEPTRLSEISSNLDIPKSNVHRIVTTFSKRGYVYQNPDTLKYSLGVSAWILGRSIEGLDATIEYLQPFLKEIGDRVEETVYIAALRQEKVVYLTTYTQPSIPGWVLKGTTMMPLHSTAAGKVFLAAKPKEYVENYIKQGLARYTEYTITDPEELRAEIELTRERGYALELEETQNGLSAIDIPINIFLEEIFSLGFFLPASKARTDLSAEISILMQTKKAILASLNHMRSE